MKNPHRTDDILGIASVVVVAFGVAATVFVLGPDVWLIPAIAVAAIAAVAAIGYVVAGLGFVALGVASLVARFKRSREGP